MKPLLRFVDWPLRAKMAALLIVASVLPLGVAAFVDVREARERLLANTGALLAARGDQLAGELDTFHRGYQRSVAKFARLPAMVEFFRGGFPDASWLESAVSTVLSIQATADPAIRGVALLDLSGTVRAATEKLLLGADLSGYGHVREALRGNAVVSDVYLAGPQVGYTPTIAYLAPVLEARKTIGAAVLWVRATSLWELARASNELAGPHSFAVLFDHQGVRIAHTYSRDIVFHPGGRLDDATVDAMVAEGRFGEKTREFLEDVRRFPEQFDRARSASPDRGLFRGFAPVNQKWNYGVGRRLQTVPWTLFYMIPEESLNAQISGMTRRRLVFAVAIILGALAVGTLFAAVVLKPIRSLSRVTESLASGDLGARVHEGHADEIGRLGRSFNSMADRIEAQALATQRARDDLEVRVEQRTADLLQTTKELETEIVERRRAEEALRESEQSLATTLNSIGDAVIATDLEGNLVRMNPVAELLTGWPLEEAQGRPLSEVFRIVNEEARLPVEGPVSRVLREGVVVGLANHTVLISRNGRERPIADSGAPIRDARGTIRGVVLVFRDQTEERRMEEVRAKSLELETDNLRIQEANRLKGEFLANMSHELRTPLNAIIGFSELMQDGKAGPVSALQEEYLGDVLSSSRHLLQLINDVLDLSKVESGKMEFRPEPVELPEIIGEVCDILRTLAAEKRIRIEIEESSAVSGVVADLAKLKQVLYNYLSNALKFTPEDGRVIARVLREGSDQFRIEVEDTGIGIRQEDLGRLFSEFQQLDPSAGKKYAGTGLGLALTKRIVESQGGRVGVRSEPGKGSVFFATLPLVCALPSATESRPEAPVSSTRVGAPRVLVIEDDPEDRAWLTRTLTREGYAVEAVANGRQGLEQCAAQAFDAITLDLLLPDISGRDVLEAIRGGGPNLETPVIIVSVVAEKGIAAGFHVHDFLSKPIRGADLLAALERAGLPPGGERSVLVVDENVTDLKLADRTLRQLGYRPDCHASAGSALEAAGKNAPSAVVLDLSMPNVDGFEFLRRFRATPAGRRTPVVVWTVMDLTESQRRNLEASVQAIVSKTDGAATLIEELNSLVPPSKASPGVVGRGSAGSG